MYVFLRIWLKGELRQINVTTLHKHNNMYLILALPSITKL
jgi:hypothetical protein